MIRVKRGDAPEVSLLLLSLRILLGSLRKKELRQESDAVAVARYLMLICVFVTLGLAVGAGGREPTDPSARYPEPLSDADFRRHDTAKIALGQALFFDKFLSGNKNISCGTCHAHSLGSGDGLSLGLGEGAQGLGPRRAVEYGGVEHRVPRNAPALFNLGAKSIVTVFWDGRLEVDPKEPSGFRAPDRFELPAGLESITAAQALFPLVSEIEMAGAPGENEIATLAFREPKLGWAALERRLRASKAYWPLFQAAYPELKTPQELKITHVGNALGAFIDTEWRADQSPFDKWLRGDRAALSASAQRGAKLFYGAAGCATCHSGALQTDQRFHAIAMPQIGPGRTPLLSTSMSDFGRMATTGALEDAYRFRAPSLRNILHTAPYGHAGAYATLDDVLAHHFDPEGAFEAYEISKALLPANRELERRDHRAMSDPREAAAILDANELIPARLTPAERADLKEFLKALTDPASLRGRLGKPLAVPSGLTID